MTCSVAMMCPTLLVSFFIWIIVPDLCRSQEERYAGPYRILMDWIGQCDESGTHQIYATSSRVSKISRTEKVYMTNVTLEIPISDELSATADIAKFGNGGYRPHFIQMDFPQMCTSVKTLTPRLFNTILKSLHADCPMPPGHYEINDLDVVKFEIGSRLPSFPYGKYRTDFSGLLNGTLVGCIRFYVEVIPERKPRQQKKRKQNSSLL